MNMSVDDRSELETAERRLARAAQEHCNSYHASAFNNDLSEKSILVESIIRDDRAVLDSPLFGCDKGFEPMAECLGVPHAMTWAIGQIRHCAYSSGAVQDLVEADYLRFLEARSWGGVRAGDNYLGFPFAFLKVAAQFLPNESVAKYRAVRSATEYAEFIASTPPDSRLTISPRTNHQGLSAVRSTLQELPDYLANQFKERGPGLMLEVIEQAIWDCPDVVTQ